MRPIAKSEPVSIFWRAPPNSGSFLGLFPAGCAKPSSSLPCSNDEPCRHGPCSSFRSSEEPHAGFTTVVLGCLTRASLGVLPVGCLRALAVARVGVVGPTCAARLSPPMIRNGWRSLLARSSPTIERPPLRGDSSPCAGTLSRVPASERTKPSGKGSSAEFPAVCGTSFARCLGRGMRADAPPIRTCPYPRRRLRRTPLFLIVAKKHRTACTKEYNRSVLLRKSIGDCVQKWPDHRENLQKSGRQWTPTTPHTYIQDLGEFSDGQDRRRSTWWLDRPDREAAPTRRVSRLNQVVLTPTRGWDHAQHRNHPGPLRRLAGIHPTP